MQKHIYNQLIEAMDGWADIANPEASFTILNSPMMTPKEMVEAIKEKSEIGVAYMNIIEYAVRVEGIHKVKEKFSL